MVIYIIYTVIYIISILYRIKTMSLIEPFTPEGVDPNNSYVLTCIDRVNTNYKAAIAAIPGVDLTLRPDLNTNIANTNTNTGNIATLTTKMNNSYTTINVKDYGAIGDNINDDTTSIQNAIDATSTDYGILYFPKGQYKITRTLNIFNKTNFLLKSDNAGIYCYTLNGGYLFFNGCNHLEIDGSFIIVAATSGLSGSYGMVINNCMNSNFKNIFIVGDFAYGIYANINGTTYSVGCSITATISECRTGLYLRGEYYTALNCQISRCTQAAVLIEGGNNKIVGGNYNANRIGCYIRGLVVSNSDHGGIYNATFNHNNVCGVFVKNLEYTFNIIGCQIWASVGPGTFTEASNVTARSFCYGVYLENVKGIAIVDNTIAHNNHIELGYDGLTNSIINNNIFRSVGTGLFPIYEWYTAGNSYSNNQFCNNIFSGSSAGSEGVSSSLLRFYLGNAVNDGASSYIIKDNTGENKNNNLLMDVNSGDYYIGCANNYVIDGLTITTSNNSDPAGQTANIYILPHATGTYFKLFFRRNNITGYTWLRYKTNNTSLAPYIIGNNVVYSVAIRCFRIGPLNTVEFTPMSNTGLGQWCIVGA